MSEKYEYDRGISRGKEGKSELYGLLEPEILVSDKDRRARQRGYEAGAEARATAEAIREAAGRSERTFSSEASSSTSSGPMFDNSWMHRHEDGVLAAFILFFSGIFVFLISRWLYSPSNPIASITFSTIVAVIAGSIVGMVAAQTLDFILEQWLAILIVLGVIFGSFLYATRERPKNPEDAGKVKGYIAAPNTGGWSDPVAVPAETKCVTLERFDTAFVQVKERGDSTWRPLSSGTNVANLAYFRIKGRPGWHDGTAYELSPRPC